MKQATRKKREIKTINDLKSKRAQTLVAKLMIEYGRDYFRLRHKEGKVYQDAADKIKVRLNSILERLGIRGMGDTFIGAMRAGRTDFVIEGIKMMMGMHRDQIMLISAQLDILLKDCSFLRSSIGENSLEIGCGLGWLEKPFEEKLGVKWYGVDTEKDMIDIGRFFGAKNTRVVEKDIDNYELPFETGFFDSVFSIDALFSDNTPEAGPNGRVLEEIARVVKPFGVVLIHPFERVDGMSTGIGRYSPGIHRRLKEVGFEFACADKRGVGWGVWIKV